jgi:hypothetical protein
VKCLLGSALGFEVHPQQQVLEARVIAENQHLTEQVRNHRVFL